MSITKWSRYQEMKDSSNYRGVLNAKNMRGLIIEQIERLYRGSFLVYAHYKEHYINADAFMSEDKEFLFEMLRSHRSFINFPTLPWDRGIGESILFNLGTVLIDLVALGVWTESVEGERISFLPLLGFLLLLHVIVTAVSLCLIRSEEYTKTYRMSKSKLKKLKQDYPEVYQAHLDALVVGAIADLERFINLPVNYMREV